MKQKLLATLISIGAIFSISLLATPVNAVNVWQGCAGNNQSEVCKSSGTDNATTTVKNLINLALWAIGIVAVIVIIISGYKFITANGEAAKVASARNTLLYSVIGLVVAMLAWGIVAFIVNRM